MRGLICFVGFLATIPAANWLIGNVGTKCIPNGPCLIPVGFGQMAPSGVLLIGLAFVLRDLLQREWGAKAALLAIAIGAALSSVVASPALVIASTAAFLASEIADFAVYTPLRERGFVKAVLASSVVGLLIDSVLFLWLAFGNLDHLAGQIVGKVWMVAGATMVIALLRRRAAA